MNWPVRILLQQLIPFLLIGILSKVLCTSLHKCFQLSASFRNQGRIPSILVDNYSSLVCDQSHGQGAGCDGRQKQGLIRKCFEQCLQLLLRHPKRQHRILRINSKGQGLLKGGQHARALQL